jgi:hypothetical protein
MPPHVTLSGAKGLPIHAPGNRERRARLTSHPEGIIDMATISVPTAQPARLGSFARKGLTISIGVVAALLSVGWAGLQEEVLVIRFNPERGKVQYVEAMKYRAETGKPAL